MKSFKRYLRESAPTGHIRLYHGTLRRHVPSIKHQGLRRTKVEFIWATESESFAREFATGLTYGTNEPTQPAVIEFTVPRKAVAFERPYTPGKRDPVGTRVCRILLDVVPPEWILSVK